jgi:hypothetical protein
MRSESAIRPDVGRALIAGNDAERIGDRGRAADDRDPAAGRYSVIEKPA